MSTDTWLNMTVWHSTCWWIHCEVLSMQWRVQAGYYWTLQRHCLLSPNREWLAHKKRKKRAVVQVC